MGSKDGLLGQLAIEIKACKKCPLALCRDEPTVSRGDPRSPLMVVTDYPREADHKSGQTLSGRAGKKIDELLEKAGLKPDQVYFTSLMKCFPGRGKYFPEDGSPAKCFGFLMTQMKIIKPLVVVLSGPETVAWTLLRGTGEKVDPKGEDLPDWMGRMYRRREIYEELRFVIVPNINKLSKDKNEDLDAKVIADLAMAKEFIVARQKGDVTPNIIVHDIEKKVVKDKNDQGELFKWTKPQEPPKPN